MRECVCSKCGATLSLNDTNRDFAFCEFCGAKIMFDDYRMTQHIIDEAKIKKVEVEQEKVKLKALQSQHREILEHWDYEQSKEEEALARKKKNLNTCLWLCLLGVGIYALPFVWLKYNRLKTNYETTKKHRDYMRQLPLDRFFEEMENEWQNHKENGEKTSFLNKTLW